MSIGSPGAFLGEGPGAARVVSRIVAWLLLLADEIAKGVGTWWKNSLQELVYAALVPSQQLGFKTGAEDVLGSVDVVLGYVVAHFKECEGGELVFGGVP